MDHRLEKVFLENIWSQGPVELQTVVMLELKGKVYQQ